MTQEKKIRKVNVMSIQKYPPEKVVELFEDYNEGKVLLRSIYRDRWAQIGLESPTLDRFVRQMQGIQDSAIAILMRKLSKGWIYEDEKAISRQTKSKNSKTLHAISKTRFHRKKVL